MRSATPNLAAAHRILVQVDPDGTQGTGAADEYLDLDAVRVTIIAVETPYDTAHGAPSVITAVAGHNVPQIAALNDRAFVRVGLWDHAFTAAGVVRNDLPVQTENADERQESTAPE